MSNLRTINFLIDLRWAKRKKYCASRFCTTCGATPLRKLLSKYTEAEIIEGMKKISGEYLNQFIDCIEGKEILIFLFYQLTKSGSGYDLIEIFEGKPICIFLHEAIQFKENRKLKHQRILENQHEAHLNKFGRKIRTKVLYDMINDKLSHNLFN